MFFCFLYPSRNTPRPCLAATRLGSDESYMMAWAYPSLCHAYQRVEAFSPPQVPRLFTPSIRCPCPPRLGQQVGIGTDRFKVPELLVNTSPLTNALQASGESCPPALRALAKSLDRPGFVLRPLQVQRSVESSLIYEVHYFLFCFSIAAGNAYYTTE